jgi:hypothetical protein
MQLGYIGSGDRMDIRDAERTASIALLAKLEATAACLALCLFVLFAYVS